jgi:hypothetical protein
MGRAGVPLSVAVVFDAHGTPSDAEPSDLAGLAVRLIT